jgi:hypothetical protein
MPTVRQKAESLGWSDYEVFSDGWDDPQDWNMMVEYATHSTDRLTDVILLNVERWHGKVEEARKELGGLLNSGVITHLCQGFLPEIRAGHLSLRLFDMIRAFDYYQEVMSLKTREGMRHKKGGRLPFGLKWEDSVAVPDENYPLVQQVMEMHRRELSVPEIATSTKLSQSKVRTIIRAWKDRINQ